MSYSQAIKALQRRDKIVDDWIVKLNEKIVENEKK